MASIQCVTGGIYSSELCTFGGNTNTSEYCTSCPAVQLLRDMEQDQHVEYLFPFGKCVMYTLEWAVVQQRLQGLFSCRRLLPQHSTHCSDEHADRSWTHDKGMHI